MKTFLILLTAFAFTPDCNSQSAEDSVKSTVNSLFTSMKNADAALFRSVFGKTAILQTITRTKEGKTDVMNQSVDEVADFVISLKKDSADERIIFETIKINGSLASVWTPYTFYHNGKFSHCGVNSFQLVRFDGIWKIHYLIDTRRRQGCPQ